MVKQDQVIIYIQAGTLNEPSWSTGTYFHKGELENLAAAAKNREVMVVVPAEEILLRSLVLPKMNKTRLLQAIPFALEEQLVGEIEDLHFAVGDYQADGSLPVAVVNKKRMLEWRQLLQTWNVHNYTLIPAMLALPNLTNHWQVLVAETSVVRTGAYEGFAIENANLIEFLTIALKERALKESATVPQQIHFYNYTSHAYAASLEAKVAIQEDFFSPEKLIEQISQFIDGVNNINLLQGEFTQKKPTFSKLQVKWKVAAYLAVAWLGLLVMYPIISYSILKFRLVAVNNQIADIHKRHFPKATDMVAAKARLQDKLESMMAQLGQNRLLLLLGYVGKGIKETPAVKLRRFDFHNNQLVLDVTAATSEDLSALTDYLVQQGLSVKQQSTDVVGSRLQATMVVE